MKAIQIFNKAKKLRDAEKFQDSNIILINYIKKKPMYSKRNVFFRLIAGNFFDLKDYYKAIDFSRRALNINRNDETAALTLYLSYCELEFYEFAIDELINYLNEFEADLFLTTLEELIDDINDGSLCYRVHELKFLQSLNRLSST